MPYTQEHKSRTRARIVESARLLFNRHGFSGVSIDDIMAEAGLTRGGFYNHFSAKDELYAEVVAGVLACDDRQALVDDASRPDRRSPASSSAPISRNSISTTATTAAR